MESKFGVKSAEAVELHGTVQKQWSCPNRVAPQLTKLLKMGQGEFAHEILRLCETVDQAHGLFPVMGTVPSTPRGIVDTLSGTYCSTLLPAGEK